MSAAPHEPEQTHVAAASESEETPNGEDTRAGLAAGFLRTDSETQNLSRSRLHETVENDSGARGQDSVDARTRGSVKERDGEKELEAFQLFLSAMLPTLEEAFPQVPPRSALASARAQAQFGEVHCDSTIRASLTRARVGVPCNRTRLPTMCERLSSRFFAAAVTHTLMLAVIERDRR
eukprot:3848876-Rhodomonas_salina.4